MLIFSFPKFRVNSYHWSMRWVLPWTVNVFSVCAAAGSIFCTVSAQIHRTIECIYLMSHQLWNLRWIGKVIPQYSTSLKDPIALKQPSWGLDGCWIDLWHLDGTRQRRWFPHNGSHDGREQHTFENYAYNPSLFLRSSTRSTQTSPKDGKPGGRGNHVQGAVDLG
jgi:hypothetical protein